MISNQPGFPLGDAGVSNSQGSATSAEARAIQRQVEALSESPARQRTQQIELNQKRILRRDDQTVGLLSESDAPLGMFVDSSGEQYQAQEELLVRTDDLNAPATGSGVSDMRGHLADFVVEERVIAKLDGKITSLRLRPDAYGPPLTFVELEHVASTLRAQGYQASVNQDVPLGYPTKATFGPIGPEPSDREVKPVFPGPRPTGQGGRPPVSVAVVDTGIVGTPREDHWLDGVQHAALPADIDPLYQFNQQVLGPDTTVFDFCAGHGTFVCGVIAQVAPHANIRMYRAINGDGNGGDLDVAIGIWKAFNDGARIINLSLGTLTPDDQPPLATLVALELIAARRVEEGPDGQDVVVVAAAGNNGSTRPVFPAALCVTPIYGVHVVSVAGLTGDFEPAEFSTRGFWVTCSTAAVGVLSTFVAGSESPDVDDDPDKWEGTDPWAVWCGTSFAAPQVAGAIALRCETTGDSPELALRWLLDSGVSMPNYGKTLKILQVG